MDAAAAELDADEVEMQRQQLQHKQHVAAVAHSARMSLAQQCAAALPPAVGRRQVHCTLIVKIIWILLKNIWILLKLKAKVAD
jgi:hypothetical protein